MIQYEHAEDIKQKLLEASSAIGTKHDFSRVICLRSRGSKGIYTLARCHALSRAMQKALGVKAHYVIEVVSEKYDKLSDEEKVKTLIHELLHIPKSFGGGLKGHGVVNRRTIDDVYRTYVSNRKNANN